MSGRKTAQALAVILFTAFCLWFAFRGLEPAKLRDSFADANYWMLLPMMGILVSFYALKAWRWALLLTPVASLTPVQVTPAMMIGFMANNLLPAHLGEFARVFVLGEQYQLKKTPVLSTVVLERVFDILAILLLLGISLLFADGMPPKLQRFCQIFGVLSLAGVVSLIAYMTFTSQFLKLVKTVFGWFPFLPDKLTGGVLGMLESAAVGLDAVRNPRLLPAIAFSSVAQWLLNGLLIYCSAHAFGVAVSYVDSLMVMGVIVFAILLPAPPGYFGVIQVCFKLVLESRFAAEEVVACSMFYQVSQYIPVTLTGLVFLSRVGLSLGSLQAAKGESAKGQSGKLESGQTESPRGQIEDADVSSDSPPAADAEAEQPPETLTS